MGLLSLRNTPLTNCASTAIAIVLLLSFCPSRPARAADSPRTVLDKGLKVTGLTGEGAPAYHLKADYSFYDKGVVIESGTIEEWATGPSTWKRAYTEKKVSSTEWSIARGKRVQTRDRPDEKLDYARLDLRVGTLLTNPLFQATNFKPEVELKNQAGTFAGLILDCVSAADPGRYAGKINPDLLFPMYCFDVKDATLRYTKTSDTLVAYSDFKPFQNRSVSSKVEVNVFNKLISKAEITLLEPLSATDQAQLTPPANTVPQPYLHQPGDAPLVLVRITECAYPMAARNKMEYGAVYIPVIIKKDGSVKNNGWAMGPRELAGAASDCTGTWKFEPFKIDGEAVDVAETLIYTFDGKPFKGTIGIASQPPPPPVQPAAPSK